ncbi:MAG: hypothetical protein ACYDH1_05080 [Anaerolineaceae bacterium]
MQNLSLWTDNGVNRSPYWVCQGGLLFRFTLAGGFHQSSPSETFSLGSPIPVGNLLVTRPGQRVCYIVVERL